MPHIITFDGLAMKHDDTYLEKAEIMQHAPKDSEYRPESLTGPVIGKPDSTLIEAKQEDNTNTSPADNAIKKSAPFDQESPIFTEQLSDNQSRQQSNNSLDFIPEGLENTERLEAPPTEDLPGDDFRVFIPEGLENTEVKTNPPTEEPPGEDFDLNWPDNLAEDIENKIPPFDGSGFRAEHDNFANSHFDSVNPREPLGWDDTDPFADIHPSFKPIDELEFHHGIGPILNPADPELRRPKHPNDNNVIGSFGDSYTEVEWTYLGNNNQPQYAEAIGLNSSSLGANFEPTSAMAAILPLLADSFRAEYDNYNHVILDTSGAME